MIRGSRRRQLVRAMLNTSVRENHKAQRLYRGDWAYRDLSHFLDGGTNEQIVEIEKLLGIIWHDRDEGREHSA